MKEVLTTTKPALFKMTYSESLEIFHINITGGHRFGLSFCTTLQESRLKVKMKSLMLKFHDTNLKLYISPSKKSRLER
jgi:hypothetical protein